MCLGGGLELAMACHMRICGDRVRLGQPEINLGIIPGWGGTQRLPRIVGPAKATELILTGDQITAQQAMQLRLVNMVVPGGEVMRQAKGLAAKIANKSAVSVGGGVDGDPRRPRCRPAGRPGGRARAVRHRDRQRRRARRRDRRFWRSVKRSSMISDE